MMPSPVTPSPVTPSPVSPGPTTQPPPRADLTDLAARLKPYQTASWPRAIWQLASSLIPFLALWALMYQALDRSYWTTLALAVSATAFFNRLFIIQHDLGHGSFFPSKRVNDRVGAVLGVLTLVPYHHWRRLHCNHHGHFGNLEKRGPGYIETLTVEEYRLASRWQRVQYRLYRNPLLMFGPGAAWYFFVAQRFPYGVPWSWKRERRSVYLTDLSILCTLAVLGFFLGGWKVLAVHATVVSMAAPVGMWMFYIQHQFEDTYWERSERWNFVRSALEGSSYYQLPRFFQWCTGNVGLHHVHHLAPKVPNYYLQRCHDAMPELRSVRPLRFLESLGALRLRLWDEERRRMVGFREAEAGAGPRG